MSETPSTLSFEETPFDSGDRLDLHESNLQSPEVGHERAEVARIIGDAAAAEQKPMTSEELIAGIGRSVMKYRQEGLAQSDFGLAA